MIYFIRNLLDRILRKWLIFMDIIIVNLNLFTRWNLVVFQFSQFEVFWSIMLCFEFSQGFFEDDISIGHKFYSSIQKNHTWHNKAKFRLKHPRYYSHLFDIKQNNFGNVTFFKGRNDIFTRFLRRFHSIDLYLITICSLLNFYGNMYYIWSIINFTGYLSELLESDIQRTSERILGVNFHRCFWSRKLSYTIHMYCDK